MANGNPPPRKTYEETTYDGTPYREKRNRTMEGQDPITGRFAPGNKLQSRTWTAQAMQKRMKKLKNALMNAATPDDIHTIARRVIGMAKKGNIRAAEFVYDRIFGKPVNTVELTAQLSEEFYDNPIQELSSEQLMLLLTQTDSVPEVIDAQPTQSRQIEENEEEETN